MSEVKSIIDMFNYFKSHKGIVLAILLVLILLVLLLYKKGKETIKESSKEFCSDLRKLIKAINQLELRKKVTIAVCAVIILGVILVIVSSKIIKANRYQEIALLNDQNEVVKPMGIDIFNETQVGDYTFFRYKVEEKYGDDVFGYLALDRWKKGELAERISERACPHFEVAHNTVIYLDSSIGDLSHGLLYAARPNRKAERVLEQELYQFSVVNDYIYFIYCYDTVGAGLEGHALHRMDINGDNIITVAYEVCGPGLRGSKYNFKIEDGWAVYSNYKIKIGGQADGLEKVVLLDNTKEDWIYYTSNKLIKARPDGTEQVVLDDGHSTYFWIDRIEDGWIYYCKGDAMYKIDINGNNKEMIEY